MQALKSIAKAVIPESLWKRARAWKMARIGKEFTPYTTTASFHGMPIQMEVRDPMSEAWYSKGGGMIDEVTFLAKRKMQPGTTVFDIGAHQGIFAVVMAKIVGEGGKVLAVEANPYHAECATKNATLNNAPQITVANVAVASEKGQIRFSNDWGGQTADDLGVLVDAVTIDSLAEKYGMPQTLFIDVEGFECEALKGAKAVLATRPDVFIEVHIGCGLEAAGGSIDTLLALLPDGYTLWAMQDGGGETRPFDKNIPWLKERFFLLASVVGTN
jgi:FkbM family methyltransferase